ncbi:DsbC family protein [Pseudomonas sp. NPDC077405]|uniref:DsbC family protein n=1 Tax=Stutzerimonas nitrititolerans TaxID=2482751 RepID=UPI0028B08008|nr:DsbC family protein [Stutzerimonas nitrititolerans]
MKMNDRIKSGGGSILIHFGATGEAQRLTQLPLTGALSVWKTERAIFASITGREEDAIQIESFSSDQLAASAFTQFKSKLDAHFKRRAVSRVAKNIVKWAVLPAIAVFVALALNVAVTKGVQAPIPGAAATGAPPASVAVSPPYAQPQQLPSVPPVMPDLPKEADPARVSKAIATGLQSGKYSIQRSPSGKTPLYVFSDPSCPYCQRLESELEKLESDYSIHIFPVSIIGGEASAKKVVPVLCGDSGEQPDLWAKATAGLPVQGEACEAGEASLSANNQIFRGLEFLGTPTLINAKGEQLPLTVPMDASGIAQWLDSSSKG